MRRRAVAIDVDLRLDEPVPAGDVVRARDQVIQVAVVVEVEPGESAAAPDGLHRRGQREPERSEGAAGVAVDVRAPDLAGPHVAAGDEEVDVAVGIVVGPGRGVEVEPPAAGTPGSGAGSVVSVKLPPSLR